MTIWVRLQIVFAVLLIRQWEYCCSWSPTAQQASNIENRSNKQNLLQRPFATRNRWQTTIYSQQPSVWVEEAEQGFVDEDENLEPGEVCLRSVKSFASAAVSCTENSKIQIDFDIDNNRRFLSAGALVRRPASEICDAWMADSLLKEGGPNLQLMGALLVLDDLFLHHLQREHELYHDGDDSWAIHALQNFVIQCGEEDDLDPSWRSSSHVAASEMAAGLRGFVPLRKKVRTNSIYSAGYYDNDTSGFVFDPSMARERYTSVADESSTAASIVALLPSEETVQRHTTKRFSIPPRTDESK